MPTGEGSERSRAGSSPEDCFICRKHHGLVSVPGGVVFEDDLVYAGHAQIREG